MRSSNFFQSVYDYGGWCWKGFRSLFEGLWSGIPYLLSRNASDLRKEVTEEYPDPVSCRTAEELPVRTRGELINDIKKCIGCGACARVCPTACITIETELGPIKEKLWVSTFDLDLARCLYCGLCSSVCPPSSLTHTREYEASRTNPLELVRSFGKGPVTETQREKWLELRGGSEEELLW